MSEQTLIQTVFMLFDFSVKVLLLGAIAAMVTGIVRRLSVHTRHRIWTVVLLTMLMLPVLAFAGPGWRVQVKWWPASTTILSTNDPNVETSESTASAGTLSVLSASSNFTAPTELTMQATSTSAATPVSNSDESLLPPDRVHPAGSVRDLRVSMLFTAAVLTWLAGVVVMGIRLAIAGHVTWHVLRNATDVECMPASGGVRVCESLQIETPAVVDWWTPCILMPVEWRNWSIAKRDAVFAHELAHIRRRDGLTSLLAELTTVLYWFHPIAWLTRRNLNQLAELACDEAAAIATSDRLGYARHLVEIAAMNGRQSRCQPGVAMARHCETTHRVQALLNLSRPLTNHISRPALAAILMIGAPSAILLAAVHPSPLQQETELTQTHTQVDNAAAAGDSDSAPEKPTQASLPNTDTSPVKRAEQVIGKGHTERELQLTAGDDHFLRGKLPAITVNGMSANQVLRFDPRGSIGIAGKVELALHCRICVELRLLSEGSDKRLVKVSASSIANDERQFALTLHPPEGGWPNGLIRARVNVEEFPTIFQDSYIWIGNPENEEIKVPKIVDEYAGFAHMVISGVIAAHPFQVDAGVPIVFCGRFDDSNGAGKVQDDSLMLTIKGGHSKHGKTIFGNRISLMLREPESCWFEMFDALPKDGLPPGTYTVSLSSARGTLVAERSLIVRQPAIPKP